MTKIIDAADAVIQKITAFGVSDNDGRYKNTWGASLCTFGGGYIVGDEM